MTPDFIYAPPNVPLSVLYQDKLIIVVNKPSGLLSVPGKLEGRTDCMHSRLMAQYWDALLVHRLDCDTSGVMIFARTKQAQGFLGQQFENRLAKKTYVARVWGATQDEEGHIDLPIATDWPNRPKQRISHQEGRPAQTDWKIRQRSADETLVELSPRTGRSHQLRLHMLAIGHPILGDPFYAEGDARAHPRLMLHAETLALHHPGTKDWISFTAQCPF
jgi:tRNA pseudouridine32 synthase/23S rRNA pseudouridine746 synthase